MKINSFLITLSLLLIMQTSNAQTYVILETSMGNMKIKLYDETPLHKENFIKLVKEGYYDNLLFHRVIKEFMIQGGDPNSRNASATAQLGVGGPSYTVPAELSPLLYHKKGVLAAARQGDQVNPKKASSGSQFYIVQGKKYTDAELNMMETRMGFKFSDQQRADYKNIGGTPFLDRQYTVFCEVVEGLEIIDAIGAVATGAGDRPKQNVTMKLKIVQ